MSLSVKNNVRQKNINPNNQPKNDDKKPSFLENKYLRDECKIFLGANALAAIMMAGMIMRGNGRTKQITEKITDSAEIKNRLKSVLDRLAIPEDEKKHIELLDIKSLKLLKNGEVKITYGPEASPTRLCYDKDGKYYRKITCDHIGGTIYDAEDNEIFFRM